VRVPGIPKPVTSANVTPLLLHDLYQGAPAGTQEERHDENAAVANAVVSALSSRPVDVTNLAHVLAADVAGRHLIVWDDRPANEATLGRFGASGAIDAVNPTRAFHLAVENAGATKLDYYVRIGVDQHIAIDAGGTATINTAVTVVNHAPAGQKPSYQLGPDDTTSILPGQYVANVYLWGPRGSSQVGSVAESGLRVSETAVSVLPQRQTTVHFSTTIPRAITSTGFELTYVPQPRISPTTFVATLSAPAWQSTKSLIRVWRLSQTTVIAWPLRHH
jgi:hypothetical protein